MENMAMVFSNFGTTRLSFAFSQRCDSAVVDRLIERDSPGGVYRANAFFALSVKGEADISGRNSEHRDIEQALTLK